MSEIPWTGVTWTGAELIPSSAFDLEALQARYGRGTYLRSRFSRPRSVPHHRLYWAVLQEVIDAGGPWASSEDLHESIKFHLRMVREISMITGQIKFVTRSIEFEKMDQGEFRIFFKKAMLAIEEATGINTDELIEKAKAKTRIMELV